MSYVIPKFRHPKLPVNDLGYTVADYEGALSTLCAGCGHDSVSSALIQACFEVALPPYRVAKISGIGCSSKTPTYFLGKSHGFNSVHGRMPSVATGANLANRELVYIGISGDGDTASIGLGQFAHVVRRNVNMIYIVENNGCYGLTKGQDSATVDIGSKSKAGIANSYTPIDLCGVAMQLGACFVGRAFSGDKDQLVPMIKAGITHQGFSFIDVISPCVTFNNNVDSSKSYDYVRAHAQTLGALDFVASRDEIKAKQESGALSEISMHDGSVLRLRNTPKHYNPLSQDEALAAMRTATSRQEILTGLLYVDVESKDLHHLLETDQRALCTLSEEDLCPGGHALEEVNQSLR